MSDYRVQVVLMPDSGVTADAATNTWYFEATDSSHIPSITNALRQYYTSLGNYFSSLIDPTMCEMKVYDLADPEPRFPKAVADLSDLVTNVNAGPTELAIVMSYEAIKFPGENPARTRGRVFLGPLAPPSGDRIGPIAQTAIKDAGQVLLDQSDAAADWTWMQRSATTGAMRAVISGWVDNDYDVQRRRGRKSSNRVLFS